MGDVSHRLGSIAGESQERVARAVRLRRMTGDVGDEVERFVRLGESNLPGHGPPGRMESTQRWAGNHSLTAN